MVRLWVVLCALWIAAVVAFSLNTWAEYTEEARKTWAICLVRGPFPPDESAWCSNKWLFAPANPFSDSPAPNLHAQILWGLLPPLAFLALGMVAAWVARGFRRSYRLQPSAIPIEPRAILFMAHLYTAVGGSYSRWRAPGRHQKGYPGGDPTGHRTRLGPVRARPQAAVSRAYRSA